MGVPPVPQFHYEILHRYVAPEGRIPLMICPLKKSLGRDARCITVNVALSDARKAGRLWLQAVWYLRDCGDVP